MKDAPHHTPGVFDELIARELEKVREEFIRKDPGEQIRRIMNAPRIIPDAAPRFRPLRDPIIDRDPGDEHATPPTPLIAVRKFLPVRA